MAVETTTTLPGGVYKIDPIYSSVSFKLRRGLGTFRAGIAGVTGSLEDGVLSGRVPVDGLIVPIEPLKEVLNSPDWFDGANHPTISWKSTSITADSDKIRFVGDLTVKGVTKEITGTGVVYGPAMVPSPNGEIEMMGIDITAQMNALEFGVGDLVRRLGENMTIEISLTLQP